MVSNALKITGETETTHKVRPIHSFDPARRAHARLFIVLRTKDDHPVMKGVPVTMIEAITDDPTKVAHIADWAPQEILPWNAFELYRERIAAN